MKTLNKLALLAMLFATTYANGAIQATKYYVDNAITTVSSKVDEVETTANKYTDSKSKETQKYISQLTSDFTDFIEGSNVIFSVTNYISGVYSIEYPKLRILELKSNTNEYTEVYNSRSEIIEHISNFSNTVFKNELKNMKTDLQAWGKYMSSGESLEEIGMSNTVYMTAGHVVFAGDTAWERVAVGEGCIWALVSKGARTYTTGDESTFKFQDEAGTNYFGFAKTDSYVLGCNTDGIDVTGEDENRYVTLTYELTASVVPCIYYSPTITEPITWEKLNDADGSSCLGTYTVQWEQNPPLGKMICYITVGYEPQGFFRAELEVPGDAKFITNMPADLQGGIIATNETSNTIQTIYPVIRNGSVVWEVK